MVRGCSSYIKPDGQLPFIPPREASGNVPYGLSPQQRPLREAAASAIDSPSDNCSWQKPRLGNMFMGKRAVSVAHAEPS